MTTTIDELLDKLAVAATTTTAKGNAFERLMASYLRTAPEFADRFEDVYLWQDWPGRGNQHDHGIDIVARDSHTDGWCAIQCKFYDRDHHVAKGDIDSFLAASSKKGFTSRVIISTAKDWGPTAERQMADLIVPVVRLGVADLLESKVDWMRIDPAGLVPDRLPTTAKNDVRPHQREAMRAVREGFATHDRGRLIMACGTGKTFTALKIAEEIAENRGAEKTRILFLVPSIWLLNQALSEWKRESQTPFRAFAVCSDTHVGRNDPSEDLPAHDLIYPATTEAADLAREMSEPHEDDRFTVVFGTYQSIGVVADAQRKGVGAFDLIICDEAHRTTGVTLVGEDESHFVRVHDDDFLGGVKRLYMTATPRIFSADTKEKAKEAEAAPVSMDDEALFGPQFHRLGFGEAVERDLLTDYRVLVLTVDEAYVAETFQQAVGASGEIQLGDAAKIVGCWNGLAKRFGELSGGDADSLDLAPMRRAVAFAKDIKTSKATSLAFPDIVERHVVALVDDGATAGHDLRVEARHVDGTMNASERKLLLQWLKDGAPSSEPVCRILSNARCLSEGVDVPALDAVLFLTPRRSQVDVVQSVGRVMRKSEGKDFGYIVLPVVIPAGVAPEEALNDNERFRVVWQVLQALRAHDDQFNAMVNKIELNHKRPDKIKIFDVSNRDEGKTTRPKSLQLAFDIEGWRDSIFARIVKRVGERRYWETWAKDVADIAQQHIVRINGLLSDRLSPAAVAFDGFLGGLRGNLNAGVSKDDAIEMLAQHLITRPVFDALFAGYHFTASNPVAQSMERMLEVLDEHALDTENASLAKFYASVRARVEGVDNAEGRQRIIIELYDKFFKTAFKKTVEKLGIVYTPVEIVDFILHSADQVLRAEFGQGLTDEGVHILDGFTGTGTFIVRLLQSGLIRPEDLATKYAFELHANEILLLAYYIAAVNIETTYQDIMSGNLDEPADYEPFTGLILTDTFQSWEDDDTPDLEIFPENNDRLERLKELPITVIVGNPPYSAGQDSANDDNQNEKYPHLDATIRDTYAARSTATLKNSLYDSYIRAIRWATLRIKDRGIVGFVTNGGFLDSNTADGMRKQLADECAAIYVLNLRGNQRTAGELSKKEGGKVFDAGSRATVAITLLVKDPAWTGPPAIRYADIGDYLSRGEKLTKVAAAGSFAGLDQRVEIVPNGHGDWLNQRREDFADFLPIASKSKVPTVIQLHSSGTKTNRDAWAYNFRRDRLESNMSSCIDFANIETERIATLRPEDRLAALNRDPGRISWDRSNVQDTCRGRRTAFDPTAVRLAMYRPFVRSHLYFDRAWNNDRYRLPSMFPTGSAENWGFVVSAPGASAPFSALAVNCIPDCVVPGAGNQIQFLSRWRYQPVDDGALVLGSDDDVRDGFRRVDNVTDEALRRFRSAYGPDFTTDDIFFYIYGLLHSRDYRTAYAADLRKMLPHIPLVEEAEQFVVAGRALAGIHLGYESAIPYPLDGLDGDEPVGNDAYEHFRVEKMRFGAVTTEQRAAGETKDRSTVIYNSRITLRGIPEQADRYQLGSRSAIEWIMDRYQVRTDKDSGIVNDPNDWSREVGNPRYIVDMLGRIVTVSLETMQIVDRLPPLAIRGDQGSSI